MRTIGDVDANLRIHPYALECSETRISQKPLDQAIGDLLVRHRISIEAHSDAVIVIKRVISGKSDIRELHDIEAPVRRTVISVPTLERLQLGNLSQVLTRTIDLEALGVVEKFRTLGPVL